MTKINLGTFYGYNINLEIPTKEYKKQGLDEKYWQNRYQEVLKEYYKPTGFITKINKKWWQKLW